jgi:hypothetical protein
LRLPFGAPRLRRDAGAASLGFESVVVMREI